MTIWEHLNELRSRLVRAASACSSRRASRWAYRVQILAWLIHPYETAWMARKMPGTPRAPDALARSTSSSATCSSRSSPASSPPRRSSSTSCGPSSARASTRRRSGSSSRSSSSRRRCSCSGVAFAYYVAFPFTFNYFFSLLGQVEIRQRHRAHAAADARVLSRLRDAHAPRVRLRLRAAALHLVPVASPASSRRCSSSRFGRWAISPRSSSARSSRPAPRSEPDRRRGALVVLYFLSVGLSFLVAKRRDTPKAAD